MSIQQVVEEAFAPLVGGVAPTIAGAGRTDAGVHALGQVASVNARDRSVASTPSGARSTSRLPADVRVLGVEEATPGISRAVSRRPASPTATGSSTRRCCRRSIGWLRLARARAAATSTRCSAAAARARRPPRLRVVSGRAASIVRDDRADDSTGSTCVERRRRAASSRSTATGFCATWCARSSARWSKSAPARGRPSRCAAILAARDRARGRPDGAGARADAGARRVTERRRSRADPDRAVRLSVLRSRQTVMALADILAAVPPGSPEEALARRVDFDRLPRHVAIIMDGNGRWAAHAAPAARRRPPRRHRRRPRHRRDLGAARHLGAHALRVLGRELEAARHRNHAR